MIERLSIDDKIKALAPWFAETLEKDFRAELDVRPHILDLGYDTLKVNLKGGDVSWDSFQRAYTALVTFIKKDRSRVTCASLDDSRFATLFSSNTAGVILINNDSGAPGSFFLVAKNYAALDSYLYRISRSADLNKFNSVKQLFGVTQNRRGFDIGHISSKGYEGLDSPLEEKLKDIQRLVVGSSPRLEKAVDLALRELYSIQASFSYEFKNVSDQAIELARNVLGESRVVVTLHTSKLNNTFATKEGKILAKLKQKILKELEKTVNFSGSNNILEDVEQGLQNILLGNGKKLVKHNKQSGIYSTNIVPKSKVSSGGTVKLKNLQTNRSINLVTLQSLLNFHLQDVLSANMGNGSSRDILNYRTGRFAASAKVERVSQSREGAITAFYSYMKNPYQTFEPGFRQGSPKSRDPKLLISRSIREIAATIVSNKLRAVNV